MVADARLDARDDLARALDAAPTLAREHGGAGLLGAAFDRLHDDAWPRRCGEWASAVWRPLCDLFAGLQAQGHLRRDIDHERLARMFLSLNLGFLVGRHLLAPDLTWSEQAEIEAITALFAQGARA